MTATGNTPSWAAAPVDHTARRPRSRSGSGSASAASAASRPATLVAAAALAAVLAVAEIVHIALRDDLVPGFRVFLALVVGSQLGLAWGLLRRSPGAALGVFLCGATVAVTAAAGGLGDGAGRLLLAVGSIAVIALLSMSMRAFPPVELPSTGERTRERTGR